MNRIAALTLSLLLACGFSTAAHASEQDAILSTDMTIDHAAILSGSGTNYPYMLAPYLAQQESAPVVAVNETGPLAGLAPAGGDDYATDTAIVNMGNDSDTMRVVSAAVVYP